MKEAIMPKRNNKMGLKKTAKTVKTTLRRLVIQKEVLVEKVVKTKVGRPPVLLENVERELVGYLKVMESKFHGFTETDVRRSCYKWDSQQRCF